MLFLQPTILAMFKTPKGMMLSDPAYEAYVASSGIDGNSDWHVDDMYSCGGPPCSAGWDFPAVIFSLIHLSRFIFFTQAYICMFCPAHSSYFRNFLWLTTY
jgi:hypothetical protein